MIGKRQFSPDYMFLEIFWIALAITLCRSVYLTWNLMWPQPWLFTIPAAIVDVPTAIGRLLGRMRIGALVGIAGIVISVVGKLLWSFPAVY